MTLSSVRARLRTFWLVVVLCCLCGLLASLPSVSATEDVSTAEVEKGMSQSYYELFGIDATTATAKEIKKAYRVAALRYHPDKVSDEASKALVHSLFIRINLANEVLADPDKRQRYDELLADGATVDYSDDAYRLLQRARDEAQYGHYRAYAMRAARGDIEWGEALVLCVSLLCAVGPACRWWWVERKRKVRAKEKAKEGVAKSKRDVEKAVKEQSRREEELEKRRTAAKREEHSDDDADADDGESEEKRKEKEMKRSRLKRTRAALRALLKPYTKVVDEEKEGGGDSAAAEGQLEADDVELLLRELPAEEVEALLTAMEVVQSVPSRHNEEARKEKTVELFAAKLQPLAVVRQQQLDEREQQRQTAAAQSTASATAASTSTSKTTASSASSSSFWPPFEVSALARAMAKHPGGSLQRWERITALVNQANDTNGSGRTRSIKEVLARVKVDEVKSAVGGGDERAFDAYLERMKKPAAAVAALVGERVGVRQGKEGGEEGQEGRVEVVKEGGKEKKVAADEWSGTEQAALEFALRTVPRDAEERWEQVAAVVVTKSKRQCIARFKLIRQQIAASKT